MPPTVHLALAQLARERATTAATSSGSAGLFAQVDAARAAADGPRARRRAALTGYFLEGGVRDNAVTAGTLARDLDRGLSGSRFVPRPLDVALGFYEIWNNKLYNSAMYVTLGEASRTIRHVHRKIFLPTYGLFDEERFVERGREVRAFDTSWGRAAMLVCEDAWHSLTGNDRRARRRADHLRLRRTAGARPVAQVRRRARSGERQPVGPAHSRHGRRARRLRHAHDARRQRGRKDVSRRIDGRRTEGRGARSRAALGGRDSFGDSRSRRRHARARRHAAHRRPRDDDAASAREHRRGRCRARRRRSRSILRRDRVVARISHQSTQRRRRPEPLPVVRASSSRDIPRRCPSTIDAGADRGVARPFHSRRDGATTDSSARSSASPAVSTRR